MSSPLASPTASIHTPSAISPEALAAAAERRSRSQPPQVSAAQLAAEHEKRQHFRRLVDPGIIRPNSKEQGIASLKTLLTIAENLLREPENPKFQQFKPTNNIIKRNLVDPKGSLEYAIELGFRPEVINFQPYYTFNPRKLGDLRIGAAILKEAVDLEVEKEERAIRAKKEEKAVKAAAAEKLKLAFMDDRKSRLLRDEMEKEAREGRAIALARRAAQETSAPPERDVEAMPMPGSGHLLRTASNSPPPYEDDSDDDDRHN